MSDEPGAARFSSVGRLRRALRETEPRYADGAAATVGQMLTPLGTEATALGSSAPFPRPTPHRT